MGVGGERYTHVFCFEFFFLVLEIMEHFHGVFFPCICAGIGLHGYIPREQVRALVFRSSALKSFFLRTVVPESMLGLVLKGGASDF